ncbi:TPA: hypothetical protein ACH27V_000886 [Klebsiella quasipneumoniae subsp. similipneumoniae]|uniref:hypothetical protein n=1 Tax=Klebsiella quasipneumoniae TaxID=1463165 RepID=UPI00164CC432|nr:hypothetical protein [Klebsiella quasipneumoniae]MBC4810888.1 hypothetical protein [Klebsiella quasipneumoniae]MDL4024593.1 hypothetical protein [Klebsiella quasipneumoniae]HBT7194952.1 hypothetical protein [Klebsiella pneumoniae]HCD3049325.1 hypothetical protein [Klebsiella variicola]
MNAKNILTLLFLAPFIAAADRGDDICQTWVRQGYGNTITTPPITGNVPAIISDLAICFKGKNYSQDTAKITNIKGLAGDGLRVVSSLKMDGYEEFYVSLYNEKAGVSAITRVFINEWGNIYAKENGLVRKKDINGLSSEGIFSFVIPGDNKTIYFNVIEPARTRVYKFEQASGYFYTMAHVKKISDGYGEYAKKNGDIVVSRQVESGGKGSRAEGFILDKNGNKKCMVDSTQRAWAFFAECD